jgi:uncharacterized RDD family membrane protein YckC
VNQPGITQHATVGARFGALLVDTFVGAVAAVPGFVALRQGPTEITRCSIDSDGNIDFGGVKNGLCESPTSGTLAVAILLFVACGLAFLLYQSKREGTTGQTIGKKAVGIATVDAATGQFIGTGRALGRALFGRFISGTVCGLGYLWAIWDPRRQTWHDKVANSVVVKA